MKQNRNGLRLAGIALLVVLGGCATSQPKPLYSWNEYQTQVYEHLSGEGEGVDSQIAKLEEAEQQAKASGDTLPPGFHAHLGMLYAKAGRSEQVVPRFEAEKQQFPESTTFVEFLASSFTKGQEAAK